MCKRWAFVSCVRTKAAQKPYDGWNLLELLRERSMRRVGVSLQIAPQLHKSSKVWVSLFEVKGQWRSCGKMNRELVRQYRQAWLVYRFQLSINKMRLLNSQKSDDPNNLASDAMHERSCCNKKSDSYHRKSGFFVTWWYIGNNLCYAKP